MGLLPHPAGKAVYFMLAFQTAPVPRWRKSSLSLANGNCVEVAAPHPGGVGVRDSTDPAGPVLRFPPGQWRAFLGRLRS